jgi:TRAP transporter TAXI family solute receptor
MPTRRCVIRAIPAGLAAAACGAGRGAHGEEPHFFRIGTAGVSGTYFLIGSVLADALSRPPGLPACKPGNGCGVPGLLAVVVSSAGSVANVAGILAGEIDSGFVQSDITFDAYTGSGPFAGEPPARTLRALSSLYPETLHLIAHRGAGIATVSDLRGKRVALDEPGSGTLADALLVLDAFGLGLSDLTPLHLSPAAALDAMAGGGADAAFIVGGYPFPLVDDAVRLEGATLVPITGPPVERLLAASRFLVRSRIPAGTYADLPALDTVSVEALWLAPTSLDEDLAYQLLVVLFDPKTSERLAAAHPRGADIRLASALDGIPIPLHPGAARFYRENGRLRSD